MFILKLTPISTVPCRASDKCQREKRKTINGDDLLWAMSTLGFEDYVEPLKLYLLKFREVGLLGLVARAPSRTSEGFKLFSMSLMFIASMISAWPDDVN